MRQHTLNTDDLKDVTGYVNTGDIERCLHDQGIKFFRGKAGYIWTTIDLINAAGGIVVRNEHESESDKIL